MSKSKRTEDVPSGAEMLAAVVQGTGKVTLKSAARPVMARLPEHLLAQVDAMARLADKSRNSMIVHLLDVAIDEVRRSMNDKANSNLDQIASEVMQDMDGKAGEREQLEA